MRFLFSSFVITGVLGAIAACGSSSSSNGSPSAGGSSTTETPEAGSNADADGGASAGSDPGTPGDPVPSGGSSAAIQVVINGQLRAFDGEAGWSKSYPDGGVQNGFQTNARDGNHWTILLAVFGDQPGTYDCGHGGGLGIFRDLPLPDGGFDPDRIEYGGTVTTAGGTVEGNWKRWQDQFGGAEPKIEKKKVNGLEVTVVELKGTFNGGMMGGKPGPGQAMLGAIVETMPDLTFIKLVGSEETVTKNREAFDKMVASVRPK